jgi:adenylate kinase
VHPEVAGAQAGADAPCKKTGGAHQWIQRPDDKEEVIGKRLEVYDAQTKPLIKHYADAGLLRVVDADAAMETVFKNIELTVNSPAH